jgi:hypothetical protein
MYARDSIHGGEGSSLGVRIMGWLSVFGALSHLPLIIAGLAVLRIAPRAGLILVAFALPATFLLLIGGVGLIMRKGFGFYLIYLAILFGAIGGLSIPLIPGLNALVKGHFYAEDIVKVTNLALLLLLVYCHFQWMDTPAPRAHVVAIVILLLLGLTHVGVVRANFDRRRETVNNIAAVPYAGELFKALDVHGPVHYRLVYSKWQSDLTSVISGRTTEETLAAFVRDHDLKTVPAERLDRFLSLAKNWKLNPEMFLTQFGSNDLCYIGRPPAHPRLVLQIGFRKSDRRFTAQTLGFLGSRPREAINKNTTPVGPDQLEAHRQLP